MDAVLLLIQAVLIFGVAFIYANLGLGGGLLFVPILLSTGVAEKDLAVPISLTLTIGTAAATAGSGFLSGSMGIGGGLLNVPLLVYVLGRKTRKAIGTSSLLIIPTAAVGFAAYVVDLALRPGGFAWPAEFVLIPILMPVVFIGASLGADPACPPGAAGRLALSPYGHRPPTAPGAARSSP